MYLAIIGRPNVGKSTLFNRLCQTKSALVFDRPGVTRDRKEGQMMLKGVSITVCDTAGIDQLLTKANVPESLEKAIQHQIHTALAKANLIIFVLDGREELTSEDQMVTRSLRKLNKPVIVAVNKCEQQRHLWSIDSAYALGFSDIVTISAEHNIGIDDLCEKISSYVLTETVANHSNDFAQEKSIALQSTDDQTDKPLKLTIIGRPNAGKSTLINALLGETRMVVSPEAGTTRDAICIPWQYQGKAIDLIDTAGLRRRSRIEDIVEKYSVQDTLKAIRFSEVVILVIDAQIPLEKQDLTLARYTIQEGRALIIAVNKIDCIQAPKILEKTIIETLEVTLGQARDIEVVYISAKNKVQLENLMQTVLNVYAAWNKRVPTGLLNRWLEHTLAKHPPPLSAHGRRIRIKYITQIKTRPPTFALFSNYPADLPLSYHRYLENSLRDWIKLLGVPLRIVVKGSTNPYVKNK